MTKCLEALCLCLLITNAGFTQKNNLEASIDKYLHPVVKGNNFSGAILIAQNGKTLISKGYGLANITYGIPNTPSVKFHIASLSKGFTAAAILQLEERGLLELSDPIIKYLPELTHFDKVTIHHLLNHTSGIPDINRQAGYKKAQRKRQTPQSLVDAIKQFKLSSEPGEKYSYSNSNYNLLARMIEITSKEDYGAYLRRSILAPLSLTNTGHRQHIGQIIENLATGYVPAGGYTSLELAPYIDWSVKTGNGSLYSTTEDLLKWMTALMEGKAIGKSSLEKMLALGENAR